MAAIQHITLEEEPVRSAVVIPFPGVAARAARRGRALGLGRPGAAPPVGAPPVGGGGGASDAFVPGRAPPVGAARAAASRLRVDGDGLDGDGLDGDGALTVTAALAAARLPESVYRRRRLAAGCVVAAVLTVLLAVARPAEAPLEAVDPWSPQVTPLTEGGSVGEGV